MDSDRMARPYPVVRRRRTRYRRSVEDVDEAPSSPRLVRRRRSKRGDDDEKEKPDKIKAQAQPPPEESESESEDEGDKKSKSSSAVASTSTIARPSAAATSQLLTTPASSTLSASTTTSTPPPPPKTQPPPTTSTSTSASTSIVLSTSQVLLTQSPAAAAPPPQTTLSTTSAGRASTSIISTTSTSSTSSSVLSAAATEEVQSKNNGKDNNSISSRPSPPNTAGIVFAVIGSVAALSLLGFVFWKLYQRRRRARESSGPTNQYYYNNNNNNNNNIAAAAAYDKNDFDNDNFDAKSNTRIMDEAMGAVYDAEGGGGAGPATRMAYTASFYSGDGQQQQQQQPQQQAQPSTPNWFERQRNKIAPRAELPEHQQQRRRPKEDRVNRWMDKHTSRMLDPNDARASMVSSVPSDLGAPPSISPASVVGGGGNNNRESVLSEMGQIRRAAVPPPLDLGMVERVRAMQGQQAVRGNENVAEEAEVGREGLRPPPRIGGQQGQTASPTAQSQARTETTWNTWGVEQHPRQR